LKLKWTRRALEQFVEAQKYIAQENTNAAREVGQHIADATKLSLASSHDVHRRRVALP
jgi:plasmid stabilization system protein ParE